MVSCSTLTKPGSRLATFHARVSTWMNSKRTVMQLRLLKIELPIELCFTIIIRHRSRWSKPLIVVAIQSSQSASMTLPWRTFSTIAWSFQPGTCRKKVQKVLSMITTSHDLNRASGLDLRQRLWPIVRHTNQHSTHRLRISKRLKKLRTSRGEWFKTSRTCLTPRSLFICPCTEAFTSAVARLCAISAKA